MKFCIHYEGTQLFISDILCDLISFVQFKKREKHPWRSVTFSKVAGYFIKSNTPQWVFFTFFKLYKWYQIAQSITRITLLNSRALQFE